MKTAGAAAVVVVGGGLWRAGDQGVFSTGDGPAYEPWKNWDRDASHPALALVRAAILAANPHNTQPWLFKIADGRVELYADTGRNLGSFDPYLRELHIGLGCALENMALTAATNGFDASITLSQGALTSGSGRGAPVLVARIDLSSGKRKESDLHAAIPRRHTNRGPYEPDRPVSSDVLAQLQQLAGDHPQIRLFLYTGGADRKDFGDAVVEATAAIIADATMVHDSERWFRYRWTDVQKYRDGPTLDAAGLSPLMAGVAKMLPSPSPETSQRYWLDATREVQVATAPLFGLIAVRDLYERSQAMRAGRVWQRMHLWATSRGLAMQPVNQPVEMVDRQRQLNQEPVASGVLARLTGDPAWKPTFAFRAGYARRAAPASPRRPVGQVIV